MEKNFEWMESLEPHHMVLLPEFFIIVNDNFHDDPLMIDTQKQLLSLGYSWMSGPVIYDPRRCLPSIKFGAIIIDNVGGDVRMQYVVHDFFKRNFHKFVALFNIKYDSSYFNKIPHYAIKRLD